MAQGFISIGSNIDKEHHIPACIHELTQSFGPLLLSSLYETDAVGFEGDCFHNMVVGFDSSIPIHLIPNLLKEIENRHARIRTSERFSSRTLDLDLLLYDSLVVETPSLKIPREEIEKCAFVLEPLAEIAPTYIHPTLKISIRELWQTFTPSSGQKKIVAPWLQILKDLPPSKATTCPVT